MKTKLLLSLSIAALLSTAGVFARHSETLGNFFETNSVVQADLSEPGVVAAGFLQAKQIVKKEAAASKELISDEVAFDMFFIKVVSLERTAAKAEAKGESGNIWRNYLRRQGFTDDEVTMIRQIAKEHAAEIAPLHTRAVQIIRNGRAAIAKGQKLPPPPPELMQLQQQRSAITIRNKNKLQIRLGAAAVEKARSLMQSNSTSTQVDPGDLMNVEDRVRQFNEKRSSRLNRKEGSSNE